MKGVNLLGWKFKENSPIYLQIVDEIISRILAGYYKPGDRLPSIRELSEEAAVNPNTVQKALSLLEDMELVVSNRTSGKNITENEEIIRTQKQMLFKKMTDEYLKNCASIGVTRAEIIDFINQSENI